MLVKPNKTVVQGLIKSVQAQPNGLGREIELEISENLSPKKDEDFLRPVAGTTLKVFCADPEQKLEVGDSVEAQAYLQAGPFGEKTILQSVSPLKTRTAKLRK